MNVHEQVEAYKAADQAFYQASDLENILRNVRNGGYNQIPVENLLEDIQECIEGYDVLVESFENLKTSVKDVHSKRLDTFLQKAASMIMGVHYQKMHEYDSSDKTELKKIKAWLDEQDAIDEYLEENGHEEW